MSLGDLNTFYGGRNLCNILTHAVVICIKTFIVPLDGNHANDLLIQLKLCDHNAKIQQETES